MRNRPGPSEGWGRRLGPVSGSACLGGETADEPERLGTGADRQNQTRPKATLLVQIFALATGLPGFEACQSRFLPA